MKKKPRNRDRSLHLRTETIRELSAVNLSSVVGGCDTTSSPSEGICATLQGVHR